MVNVNKLKGKMVERGMNVEELAQIMGMNKATLYRKLRSPRMLTVGDAQKIKSALLLSNDEVIDIFFNLAVA